MRSAVAFEPEGWSGNSVRLHMSQQPNLAGATLDLVRIDVGAVRQGCQSTAELDDVAISIVPFIKQREIFNNLANCSHGSSYIGPRAAKAKTERGGCPKKGSKSGVFRLPLGRRAWDLRIPDRLNPLGSKVLARLMPTFHDV